MFTFRKSLFIFLAGNVLSLGGLKIWKISPADPTKVLQKYQQIFLLLILTVYFRIALMLSCWQIICLWLTKDTLPTNRSKCEEGNVWWEEGSRRPRDKILHLPHAYCLFLYYTITLSVFIYLKSTIKLLFQSHIISNRQIGAELNDALLQLNFGAFSITPHCLTPIPPSTLLIAICFFLL